MNPPKTDLESVEGLRPSLDPELEAALKGVLEVIYKDHPLNPNQILVLSSELQRIGVHRLVEEHLRKYRHRQEAIDSESS